MKQLQVYAAAARALAAKKPENAREIVDMIVEKTWRFRDPKAGWETVDIISQAAFHIGDAALIKRVVDWQLLVAKYDETAETPHANTARRHTPQ